MVFNAAGLFDQPEYSDIIISYSDRKTYCHKNIICTSSDYFKKLCGPGSHFAESKQDIVELEEDDPDAVFYFLKLMYTQVFNFGERGHDWRFWLEFAKVAQKYLAPDLYTKARATFRMLLTRGVNDPAAVFEAITHVRNVSDDEEILKIVEEHLQNHILALLKLPEFREWIEQDGVTLWKCLDQLTDFKAGLGQQRLTYCLTCRTSVIGDCTEVQQLPCRDPSRHPSGAFTCWVPKAEWASLKMLKDAKPVEMVEMRLSWCDRCGGGDIHPLELDSAFRTHCLGPGEIHSLETASCWVPQKYAGLSAAFNKGSTYCPE